LGQAPMRIGFRVHLFLSRKNIINPIILIANLQKYLYQRKYTAELISHH